MFKRFNEKSFTLIDVLVGTALMLIVFLGIFAAFQLGLKVVGQSRNKITATAIANQQIEMIRNLPYESVGVKGSFPDGVLDATTITEINNIEYIIEARVDFVVDSADGIALPEDECPNDYKKVEIKVSWTGRFDGEVFLRTDVAPENLVQECAIVGGILSVLVFNAEGTMVPLSLIEIRDPATEAIIKTATPEDGKHYFALAAATYKLVVSRSGYSTERTYGIDEVATPEKPHPLVLEGRVTEISFSIDKLSSTTIETRGAKDIGYPIIPNTTFILTGTKIIGTDANENPVYKYSRNHTTDGLGKITISNLEWDSYTFRIDPATGLDLIATESPPGTVVDQPIVLLPDTLQNVRLILTAENSFLITVQEATTLNPIFSAVVRLYNTDLGYDLTQYTNEKGQTYFIPLKRTTYNLEIQAPGYVNFADLISVAGDETMTVELELTEQ